MIVTLQTKPELNPADHGLLPGFSLVINPDA